MIMRDKRHQPIFRGTHWTLMSNKDEIKERMCETKRKNSQYPYWLGKKRSDADKSKMGAGHTEEGKQKSKIGLAKFFSSGKPTSIELKVYNELKRLGILFEKQKLINNKFIVDAFIPSLNLVIEADGDYWHNIETVRRKDKSENAYLTTCGFKVVRIPEHTINESSFNLSNYLT